jgi:hypothetical protein
VQQLLNATKPLQLVTQHVLLLMQHLRMQSLRQRHLLKSRQPAQHIRQQSQPFQQYQQSLLSQQSKA